LSEGRARFVENLNDMRKLILGALLLLSVILVGCNKASTVYTLNFTATHGVTQENQFCDPYGYYSWSVEDKKGNSKYEKSGSVIRQTITGTATATKGDWIYIYISVGDVFDYGSVSCKSTVGSINLYAFTDNLYIAENDSETVKYMNVNLQGTDTTIRVKEIKYQLK
jgi:hypothetical protein